MLQNYLGTKLKSNKMAFVAISLTVLYSSFHLFFQNISSKPIIQVFLFPSEANQFLRLPSKTAGR